MKKILLVWLLLSGSSFAKDLGIYGPTYLVAEKGAFDWILHERLPELERGGEIEKMQTKLQINSIQKIEKPNGMHLPQASSVRIRNKSLVFTLSRDIKDAKGRVIFKKGHTVNPADILPDSEKTLLFINGLSNKQVTYAINEYKANKSIRIVLVDGSPLELMRKHNVQIYFDQHQRLIDRFEIEALPTKVYRKESDLVIEEVVI